MMYVNKGHVDISNEPIHELMSEFTTAGQALVRKLKKSNFKKDFINELFETAIWLIQEEIENGGK